MEPDGPSNAEAVTSAASLKLPVFWHKAPKLWFAQAEAQFHIRKITSSLTKYYYTIASLPDTIATDVDDLLVPATADPYPVAHLNDFSAMLADTGSSR
uniref:DUF7041 domain-containing protein n=1 Tax=Trichuris muris TaxID=70415 RepID=A0A5S6PZB0_TRIMR